jgi:hypothetical protein
MVGDGSWEPGERREEKERTDATGESLVLVQSAWAASRSKQSYLAAQYWRRGEERSVF